MVVLVVQPQDHRWVFGQLDEKFTEAAEAVLTEHVYLADHDLALDHLRLSRGEHTVPEQGDLFFEWRLGGHQPVHPERAG